jgi:hypothetical protein
LTKSEKVLLSFFAFFAALFSIKVLSGFFLSCFLLFLPLLIAITPYNWFWTHALFIICSGFGPQLDSTKSLQRRHLECRAARG